MLLLLLLLMALMVLALVLMVLVILVMVAARLLVPRWPLLLWGSEAVCVVQPPD